jgi:hypothetical protein
MAAASAAALLFPMPKAQFWQWRAVAPHIIVSARAADAVHFDVMQQGAANLARARSTCPQLTKVFGHIF